MGEEASRGHIWRRTGIDKRQQVGNLDVMGCEVNRNEPDESKKYHRCKGGEQKG